MDNKISVFSLAANLAQTTGKSRKLCEDFIREFFRIASESLEAGELLRIKGFGSFKIVEVESRSSVNVNSGEKQEIPAYKKVVFNPSKELAAVINAPFEEFESVEIDDEVPEEIFMEDESPLFDEETPLPDDETPLSDEESLIAKEEETPLMEDEKVSDEDTLKEYRLEEGSDEEFEDDDITLEAYSSPTDPSDLSDLSDQSDQPDQPDLPSSERPQKSRFGTGFLIGSLSTFALCAVIFMLGCFFQWWPVNFGSPKSIVAETEQTIVPEAAAPQTTIETPEPEPEPIYDTVSTTRYLTTISREHYGDYNFWPYIYLENESILGHPDRITPGTKVVVPDLSKYGVDPKNKEDVKEAKKKGVEIYARFK